MAVVFYPAIIDREEDGFSVYFPDIPGCFSDGDTINEAALNAEQALNMHLVSAAEGGIEINKPSQIDAVEIDPEGDYVTRLLVRGETPGKITRIQVSIDEGLLSRIDRVAKNRSRFIADASRAALEANL